MCIVLCSFMALWICACEFLLVCYFFVQVTCTLPEYQLWIEHFLLSIDTCISCSIFYDNFLQILNVIFENAEFSEIG
jgi:hypothetical protein